MPKGQRHLTYAGRCQIHATGKSGLSGAAIARQLGRDRTTVWREVRRNPGKRGQRHGQVQGKAAARRSGAGGGIRENKQGAATLVPSWISSLQSPGSTADRKERVNSYRSLFFSS